VAPAPQTTSEPPTNVVDAPLGQTEPVSAAPAPPLPASDATAPPQTQAQAVVREALKLMDDLAGVKAAMAILAEEGQAPAAAGRPSRPNSVQTRNDPAPDPTSQQAPPTGSAPSGSAGAASSGSGSAALYALLIALAAFAGGLWGRLELVPKRWRSIAIVALNERPG
jgi:hypothetical protein